MTLISRLSFILFFLTILTSCTKVINIKLRESDIKYVVEGVITNEPGVCRVYISKSKNFNEQNSFPAVSGAVVKISDNGVETLLTETNPGVYETNTLNGIPGHKYDLYVSVNGEIFSASCTMPQPVRMDSLFVSQGPFGQFKFATITYSDPVGINNGYRFVQYVNGIKEPTIFWEDDEFTDGQTITTQLDASADEKDDPRNIKSGDEVTVEILCLDEPVFQYWYSLRSEGGDGNGSTAAPANPPANIQGRALGYFSAHTIDRRKVIAP